MRKDRSRAGRFLLIHVPPRSCFIQSKMAVMHEIDYRKLETVLCKHAKN